MFFLPRFLFSYNHCTDNYNHCTDKPQYGQCHPYTIGAAHASATTAFLIFTAFVAAFVAALRAVTAQACFVLFERQFAELMLGYDRIGRNDIVPNAVLALKVLNNRAVACHLHVGKRIAVSARAVRAVERKNFAGHDVRLLVYRIVYDHQRASPSLAVTVAAQKALFDDTVASGGPPQHVLVVGYAGMEACVEAVDIRLFESRLYLLRGDVVRCVL